jgi:hypothetical protein
MASELLLIPVLAQGGSLSRDAERSSVEALNRVLLRVCGKFGANRGELSGVTKT